MATPTRDVSNLSKRAALAEAATETATANPLMGRYGRKKLAVWAITAAVVGVLIAGMWSARAVDGFGRDVVAKGTIGDPTALSTTYGEEHGLGFGFAFALVVGMAATFTACNCVVFAMIPGMAACATTKAESRKKMLRTLSVMVLGVTVVSLIYGAFIGFLGSNGIGANGWTNTSVTRAKSLVTFSSIGIFMMLWGAVEFGFLDRYVNRVSPITRAFFAQPTVKAGIMGVLIGLFAIGRPYGPFRAFETYAAETNNATYGALVMAVQGIGQILLMIGIMLAIVYFFGDRLMNWVRNKPTQPALLAALALITGGMYFVFYWGLARMFGIGGWARTLGLY